MPMDIRSFFGKPSAKKQEAPAPRPKRFHSHVESNEAKAAAEQPIHDSPPKKPKASPKAVATPPSSKLKSPPTPQSLPSSSPSPKRSRAGSDKDSKPTPAKRSTPTNNKNNKTPTLLEPTESRDAFDLNAARAPECLQGLTFCFTGVLENLHRDMATDLIKSLGGRVTNSVSGKTSYLVVGPLLEDGRPYQEGKKYQAALEKQTKIVLGEEKLYGLCHLYQALAQEQHQKPNERMATATSTTLATPVKALSRAEPSPPPPTAGATTKVNPYSKKTPASNPYAKKAASSDPYTTSTVGTSNPYAKNSSSNPYAKNSDNPYTKNSGNPYARNSDNPYAKNSNNPHAKNSDNPYSKNSNPYGKPSSTSKPPPTTSKSPLTTTSNTNLNQLWVDRHAPQNTRDILGNKDNITKLAQWLNTWERTFNKPEAYNKSFSNPKGPWKAALLSGPPGIGSKF